MTDADERIVYLSWESPSRLFKKRDKEFFRNIAAMVFLLLVILFFAKEFSLIFAVISITFLVYVFSTIPPEEIKHALTNRGLETGGKEYLWEHLTEFWFERQWDQNLLVVVPQTGTRLILLLGNIEKDRIKDIVNRYIRFEENPQKTFVDNAAKWLSEKIPLEKPAS